MIFIDYTLFLKILWKNMKILGIIQFRGWFLPQLDIDLKNAIITDK